MKYGIGAVVVATCCVCAVGCENPAPDELAGSSLDTIVSASPIKGDASVPPGGEASQCDTLRHRALLLEQRVRAAVAAEAHDALALNDERREASARHDACMRQHESDRADTTGL